MTYEKDIKKEQGTGVVSDIVSDTKALQNNSFLNFVSKKTEKLVAALYMVTDCMDADDALKGKLRLLAVDLLSDIHTFSSGTAIQKHISASELQDQITGILSFVGIASTVGFISEMNATILKKEFSLLTEELVKHQEKNRASNFQGSLFSSSQIRNVRLNENIFEVPRPVTEERPISSEFWIKDNQSVAQVKDTQVPQKQIFRTQKIVMRKMPEMSKSDRLEKILALIKDKNEVSIKDISKSFSDCSEKTIQRELNHLISLGRVKKVGDKRWSRYLPLV